MRIYTIALGFLLLALASCKKEQAEQQENQIKMQQHTDSVFSLLTKKWDFKVPATSKEIDAEIQNWKQWEAFKKEVNLKPISSVGAFQKKTESLSAAALDLNYDVPAYFNKPEIRARITVVNNNFNNLEMHLGINPIPLKEIDRLLPLVNEGLLSLVTKMDEIVKKNLIPKEIGEQDALGVLDTIRRANPILLKTTQN